MTFEDANFFGWTGHTGACCDITFDAIGIVNGRQTIMTGNGTDPYTCGQVPVVPPGYTYSARVGNSEVGSEAEGLSYTVFVTPESDLLIYRYAVVLEDPGHEPEAQPRFVSRVTDSNGELINCTEYSVTASQGVSGFSSCNGGSIIFRNWTAVGVDVSGYQGQNVTIEFITGDCGYGGHFGYAYVVAECHSLKLDARYCDYATDQAVISAPDGFRYLWASGDTTQSIVYAFPEQGDTVSCQLTSVTGCIANVQSVLEPCGLQAHTTLIDSCQSTLLVLNASEYFNSNMGDTHWVVNGTPVSDEGNLYTHFPDAGAASILLIAENDIGCRDSAWLSTTLLPGPLSLFPLEDLCFPDSIHTQSLTQPPADGSSLFTQWILQADTLYTNDLFFTPPDTGVYDIRLISAFDNGCRDTLTQHLHVHAPPDVQFVHQQSCLSQPIYFTNNSHNGTDTVMYSVMSNGVWSNWSPTYYALCETDTATITFSAVAQHGTLQCATEQAYTLPLRPAATVEILGDRLMCADDSTTLSCSLDPASVLEYAWKKDDVLVSNDASWTAQLPWGSYSIYLTVTDTAHCIGVQSCGLEVIPNPTFEVNYIDSMCTPYYAPVSVQVLPIFINPDFTSWRIDGVVQSSVLPEALFFPEEGTYYIQITSAMSNSELHCYGDTLFPIVAMPPASSLFTVSATSLDRDASPFTASTPGEYMWEWSKNGEPFGSDSLLMIDVEPIMADSFALCLHTATSFGCEEDSCLTISLFTHTDVYIPNSITLDHNGLNEEFACVIDHPELVDQFDLKIFDRWGVLVFHTHDYSEAWNGRPNGHGAMANNDVYTWKIELSVRGELQVRTYQGSLTLLR